MAGDPAYIRNLKTFARGDLTIDDLPALEAELYGANDRASAVMLGALVENSLTTFMARQLRLDLSKDEKRRLFDYEGPLSNFASKIMLTYALGLIGPITRDDLNLIRLLRNEFAHARKPFGFETTVVAAVCKHLKTPDLPHSIIRFGLPSLGKPVDDITHPRTRYRSACHTISSSLLKNASVLYRVNVTSGSPVLESKPPLP
jgi:hypothetical protein